MAGCDKSFFRFPIPGSSASSPHSSTLLVRKSKFLTQSCQCASGVEARDFVASVKASFPDATHNCWAYVAGTPGDTAAIGSSDDGEPHGTAGRPMLQVLLHSGIGEICAVVTRWFGGIKLGTGGLARAYQDSVAENIKTLPLVQKVDSQICALTLDYAFLDALHRLLPRFDIVVEEENYLEKTSFRLAVPKDKMAEFRSAAAGISNGSAIICPLEDKAGPGSPGLAAGSGTAPR